MKWKLRIPELLVALALLGAAAYEGYKLSGVIAGQGATGLLQGPGLVGIMSIVLEVGLAMALFAGWHRTRYTGRALEFILGAVFLASALLKADDANLFAAQIHSYQVFDNPAALGMTAMVTLGIETFLGIALLLGLRLTMLALAGVIALLLFFTGLILYAWIVHGLESCGCLGDIQVTPPEAIFKNLVMLGIAAYAWRGLWSREIRAASYSVPFLKAAVCLAAAGGVLAYAYPQLYQEDGPAQVAAEPAEEPDAAAAPEQEGGPSPSTEEEDVPAAGEASPEEAAAETAPDTGGTFAGYVVEAETGETYDLSEGEYIVAMLSMTCEHCMATVPTLNQLTYRPDVPPVVAIGYEPEPGSMMDFKAQTMPEFPIHNIGNNFLQFSELIGSAPPRIAYVKDGRMIEHWDDEAPSPERIVTGIKELQSKG